MAQTLPNPLSDFLVTLTPPPSLRDGLQPFVPESFYVTTGDALAKLNSGLEPSLREYAARVRAIARDRPDSASVQRFMGEVEAALVAVGAYRLALEGLRGAAVHLETSRLPDDEHPLRVRPVDPRKKSGPVEESVEG